MKNCIAADDFNTKNGPIAEESQLPEPDALLFKFATN